MLSVSLDLVKKACMEKAGLKTMSCTIEKLNAETNFPQIFRLKSNGQEYKLYIYSEEVETLSTILSYSLFSGSGEMLCTARTEFYSPDFPLQNPPTHTLFPKQAPVHFARRNSPENVKGDSPFYSSRTLFRTRSLVGTIILILISRLS